MKNKKVLVIVVLIALAALVEFEIIDENFKSFFSKNINWGTEYYILLIFLKEAIKAIHLLKKLMKDMYLK